MTNAITVYDVDGLNPYGREVAALLATLAPTDVLTPVDAAWHPPRAATRAVLPGNLPTPRVRQGALLLRGMLTTLRAAAQRRSLVVILCRSWYDAAWLALLAFLGARVLLVEHDPTPKRRLSRRHAWARRMLLRKANVVVTHSQDLAATASRVSGREVLIVRHLPFVTWAADAPARRSSNGADRRLLLVLGHVRPDKGLDRLPEILAQVPAATRSRLSIAFVGRGDASDPVFARTAQLIDIARLPSPGFASDDEVRSWLSRADGLLAPYREASQSTGVALAATFGLDVLAYDVGAFGDLVDAERLVSPGDESGFASLLSSFASGGSAARPRESLSDWQRAAADSWSAAVRQLLRRAP